MISAVTCDCGAILDHEGEVNWHKTTKGHVWYILKNELDGNYVYAKKKIPKGARCDVCNEAPKNGKWGPKWFIVSNKDRLTVRCKKCKKERLYLIKSQFRELLSKRR
jgi:hypothetical protein